MKRIWILINESLTIAKKDLVDFARDRARIITFAIMPIFMMTLTGFIFPSENSLKNVPLGIANQDKGEVANKIVNVFSQIKISENQNAFKITNYQNIEEIKDAIKAQKINQGVVIPSDFSQKIKNNQPAEIIIVPDQSNPQISLMVNAVLDEMMKKASSDIAKTKVGEMIKLTSKINPSFAQTQPESLIEPIQTRIENIVPGKPNYFQFMAPGIIALLVMMAVMTGLAASISREKELGTLDGILIAPIARLSIILGKALAQTMRGLFQGLIVLILAILIFGVHIYGSWIMMMLLLILGIFAFIGIGILISAWASEQETAMTIMMTIQFPMMFLSGALFPIQQMPLFMQYISKALPLTYEIEALRKVIILGATASAVWQEVVILLIFGIITLSIAVPTFKRVITK